MRKIRILLTAVTIVAAITGCQHDYDMNLPLAITSRALSLTKDAGSTHILALLAMSSGLRLTGSMGAGMEKWSFLIPQIMEYLEAYALYFRKVL